MWLQSKGPPDAADGGLAQSGSGCQQAAGPVCSSFGSLLQCQPHYLLDFLVTDLTWCSRARFISQPSHSFGDETVLRNLHSTEAGESERQATSPETWFPTLNLVPIAPREQHIRSCTGSFASGLLQLSTRGLHVVRAKLNPPNEHHLILTPEEQ